jgi:hypothetical protein
VSRTEWVWLATFPERVKKCPKGPSSGPAASINALFATICVRIVACMRIEVDRSPTETAEAGDPKGPKGARKSLSVVAPILKYYAA